MSKKNKKIAFVHIVHATEWFNSTCSFMNKSSLVVMSGAREVDFKPKYIPSATKVIGLLSMHPNVKYFLKVLFKNVTVDFKQVGKLFRYPHNVEKNNYCAYYGLFMDCFLIKHLSNKYGVEATDSYTEVILNNPVYFAALKAKNSLKEVIEKHYKVFKDPKTKAMDIIRSIKIITLSAVIYFEQPLPEEEYTVNEENLIEVIKYFDYLSYNSVQLGLRLDCDYFTANPDLIFDNVVIYEIKTPKMITLTNNDTEVLKRIFYKLILYGFCYFKATGIEIKNFRIYNSILGTQYSIELDNIDFELFEKVLKHDITLSNRLEKILKERHLDLTLFREENNKNL